jgi:8-oxo-dGTP diphosphatase
METDPVRRVTRVSAYTLCVRDGRILLCRIAPGPWTAVGQWTLPGGGLEHGEEPAMGALRELAEETGLEATIDGLADVLSWSARWRHPDDDVDEDFHKIQIVYRATITGGALRDEIDGSTDAARWFSEAEVAEVPLVPLAQRAVRLAFG